MAQDVADKIRAAAVAKGVDPNTALRIAGVESDYDPTAKNPLSSAKGLFQVIDDTWKRYGGKPGKQRDTDENIRVGMDILADNTNKLTKILGRAPRPSELYTAHFFGLGTGAEVLRADPDTPINQIASKKVMAANPHLKGLTVGQLMAKHEAKFSRAPDTLVSKKSRERQDDTQKMMTDSLSSGQTAQVRPTVLDDPRIKALGTSYQMALAATALADKDDKDDDITEAERFQQYMEERQVEAEQAQEPGPARKALASFDLSYKSPFAEEAPAQQQPLQLAQGGIVHRADGSPEQGERLTPQQIEQIAQRQQDARDYRQRMADAPTRADTYTGLAKGFFQNVVPNVVGIPTDLATMALRPFGYKVEKPFLGSEYNKEKLTEFGLRPEPPKEGTNERNFYDVGNVASFFVNPASATRKVAAAGEKVAAAGEKVVEKGAEAVAATKTGVKKAKDMLNSMKKPEEVPQTARVEPAMDAAPTPVEFPAFQMRPIEPPPPVQQAEPLPPPPAMDAVPPEMAPPPPPVTQFPEVAPVAAPMQARVPADRPFVGRLDAFVDTIKNPVQLGQLKGQLKGKFRDYDIERVERAFVGMDDKTKLTPDQIKQALAGVYSPGKWISETLPPQQNKFYQSKDNVWGKELGTTNLYIEQPPEKMVAAKMMDEGQSSLLAFLTNSASAPTGTKLEKMREMLNNPEIEKIAGSELVSNLKLKFDKAEGNIKQLDTFYKQLTNIEYGLTRPVLYKSENGPSWFDFKNQFIKDKRDAVEQQLVSQGRTNHQASMEARQQLSATDPALTREAEIYASKKIQEMALTESRALDIPDPDLSLINWDSPDLKPTNPSNTEFDQSWKNVSEPAVQTLHNAAKNIQRFVGDDVKELGLKLLNAAPYRGEHTTVAGAGYPVGFTRFSEHEATIPGTGTIQGRHFHELQSDIYDEIRKKGPLHGNREKDVAEAASIQAQLEKNMSDALDKKLAVQAQARENPISEADYRAKMSEIDKNLHEQNVKIEHRLSTVNSRINSSKEVSYSMEEPFAGFESNSNLRRQLLMKNAIQSAMRDGKRFATFPGAESDYPKLYVGKIYPNLKQVIKDLGGEKSGLEIRQIELPPDKQGNPITAWGVVWSPEAAARVVEKGVPFAKGGMVERQSADTRRYL